MCIIVVPILAKYTMYIWMSIDYKVTNIIFS